MADNTVLNTGSGGDTIASDDIGGVKYQRVKLIIGADGTNDGDVASANPMPVTGTVTANLGATDNAVLDDIAAQVLAIKTAIEILDNAISGSEIQADIVSSALPTGAATAAKQPALGTAGTAAADVVTVQGITSMTPLLVNGSGATQPVSGTVTANLSATDNAVLDAIQAAVEILDNIVSGAEAQVDIVTVPAPLSTTGGGTEAAALRVTLASDSTGVVSIDDNGGSVTVDGTVTANLSATDNAVLDAIQAAVEVIDNAISGAEMQVDVVAPLPAGTNNIGDVDVLTVPAVAGEAASTMNASSGDGATALTNTAQVIKASAGSLKGYYLYNPNATAQYVQFYNTAAASVTVGTTTPLFTLTIPATSAANLWMQPGGIAFGTAMSWAATSTAAGNGAPTTAFDAVAWYT